MFQTPCLRLFYAQRLIRAGNDGLPLFAGFFLRTVALYRGGYLRRPAERETPARFVSLLNIYRFTVRVRHGLSRQNEPAPGYSQDLFETHGMPCPGGLPCVIVSQGVSLMTM